MQKGILLLFSILVFVVSCGKKPPSPANQKEIDEQIESGLVYGEDNRLENHQVSEALKDLASSTVALVESSSLIASPQGYELSGPNYGDQQRLCAAEPFREQTVGAFCSGSLVGPDLIMTAGHCIRTLADCQQVRFVFDFAVKAPGVEKRKFSQDEVYSCREIVVREEDGTGADFALIRLDRKAEHRSTLKIRRSGAVAPGEALFVIGHPAGIPQKIAGGAQVRSVHSDYFVANLDTYGGNSGSAVFNAQSKEIEGILVRGDTDFTWANGCFLSNRCADGACRGEDVTRVDQLAPFIPASGGENPPPPPPPPPFPEERESRFSVSPQLAIPDYPQAGIKSTLRADDFPRGRDVLVEVEIGHPFRGDLVLELTSPSGKAVLLHKRKGGSLDDLSGVFGDNLASFQPLLGLAQEAKTGDWVLKVKDEAARDRGVLRKWSLIFRKR